MREIKKQNLALLAMAVASVVSPGLARAAALSWDGDTSYANGNSYISGNWNGATLWRAPSPTNANVTWNGGTPSSTTPDSGTFGGTNAYTVTVDQNTTAAGVTINNGAMTINNSNNSILTVTSQVLRNTSASGSQTISTPFTFTGGSQTNGYFNIGSASSSDTVTFSGPVVINQTTSNTNITFAGSGAAAANRPAVTFSNSISVTGTTPQALVLTGGTTGSTITYSGSNSFGATPLKLNSAGTVYLGNANALAGSTLSNVSFNNSGSDNSGNTSGGTTRLLTNQALTINNNFASLSNLNNHVIGADHATGTTNFTGTFQLVQPTSTATTFSSDTFASLQVGGTAEFSGQIYDGTNSGGAVRPFYVTGPGTVRFDNPLATVQPLTVTSGTLIANGAAAGSVTGLTVARTINSNTVTVTAGSTSGLKVGQFAPQLTGFPAAYISAIGTNGAGQTVLTLSSLATGTNGTQGSGSTAGTGGSGSQSFSAGSATGLGSVTVNSGATLGGIGTIAPASGGVSVSGTIAPGDPAQSGGIGTLSLNGGSTSSALLTTATGAKFKFDLGTAGTTISTPGTSDQILLQNAAAGDGVFNNNTLDLSTTALGGDGYYKLFDTDLNSTTWTGLTTDGQIITAGLVLGTVPINTTVAQLILGNGTNGDAGDIYLAITVPEPTSIGLATALFGILALRRRRV